MKKLTALFLSAVFTIGVFQGHMMGAENNNTNPSPTAEPTPVPTLKETFGKVQGKIVGVTADGERRLMLEDKDGHPFQFHFTPNTYVLDDTDLSQDKEVICFYDESKPVPLIYPPTYPAVAAAAPSGDYSIFIGRFNENLVSIDNKLELTELEDVEDIRFAHNDEEAAVSDLRNRKLMVLYKNETGSDPMQTTPTKIIILTEDIMPLETPSVNTGTGNTETEANVENMPIVVENKVIEGQHAYKNKDGVVMVPLRAIGEALGYQLNWDEKSHTVHVGIAATVIVGRDYYTFAKMAPFQLGAAAELVHDRTYVPLAFFSKVLKINNAYIFESQIVINNGEKME